MKYADSGQSKGEGIGMNEGGGIVVIAARNTRSITMTGRTGNWPNIGGTFPYTPWLF